MFGGLTVKQDDEGKDTNRGAPIPSFSAFSFLNNATPAPAAAESPAPSFPGVGSGFSFLSAPASAPEVSEPTLALGTLSGFSFLQETTASAPDPETAAAPAPVDSGFSFMIPSPEKESTVEDTDIKPPIQDVPSPSGYSGFNFLSGDSQDEADAPRPAAMRTISVGSASVGSALSSPSPVSLAALPNTVDFPSDMGMPAATTSFPPGPPGLPTGAGLSFGTANKPVVRKKKTRAQKVGMGVAPITPSVQGNIPAPATVPKASSPSQETRDAAVEAQRRAEEFMSKKIQAEASIPVTTKPPPARMTVPIYDDDQEVTPSASTDEEVARAQRAAEEAHKISVAGMEARGGFMGTFFKGFGGTTSSINKGSGHAGTTKPGPSPTPSVDKPARQQQETKWGSTQRQTELPRHSPVDLDDDYEGVEPVAQTDESPPTGSSTPSVQLPEPSPVPVTAVVREFAPAPKKKKTPKQAFEEYQAIFAQSVHRAMQQVEAMRSQQKMLTEERFVAIAKQRLSTQQIAQTETQLQVAVDNEDYELADHLGQVVEAHNREKAEVASVLQNIARALEQLESQKALVVQGVATCFDNLAVHIKDLKEDQNEKERHSDSETFKQFELISKQLSAEQERLNQDLRILERDAQQTLQEREEVETAISEQSGAFEKQLDEAKAQLNKVEDEIAELRRQLEAKSKIASGLRTEVHGFEDSISKVRVKFSRQVARVDKKEKDLEESRKDWEAEMTAHKQQKEAHELQVQSHSEALLEHDALMKIMDKELILCKEFAGMVSTKLGFMQTETKSKEAEDAETEGNLAQLQADVVKCEAACSEAKVLAKAAMAAIANLESEVATLLVQVPQLEAEKKAAAARRDFKAASKASKEIKDATSRLKDCEEELAGEAAEKKKAAEDELARLTEELEKTRKIAEEGEKVSGIARMEDLAEQIKSLVATKKELCGDSSSNANTVKGVGAFVLEGQIKALNDEGQELGSKYGGWNDLVKDIVVTDIEPETEVLTQAKDPVDDCLATSESDVLIPAKDPVDDGLTTQERIAKVRDLMKLIEETEPLLEAAAEREDYEEAARLQEILDNALENAQSELESLNLTEEETQLMFVQNKAESTAKAEEEFVDSNSKESDREGVTMEVEGDQEDAEPCRTDGEDAETQADIHHDAETPVPDGGEELVDEDGTEFVSTQNSSDFAAKDSENASIISSHENDVAAVAHGETGDDEDIVEVTD